MALLGTAALAMWWDMAADMRPDFEDWHAHEHFPERLGIAGFRRGTRWSSADGGEGMFVLYELEDHGVLSSPGYVARLNAPSPWSTRLMPHHRNMVRSQCQVLETRGGGIARHALTVRLWPTAEQAAPLQAFFRTLVATLPSRPGLTGAHVLKHQAPDLPMTTEQRIRQGADGVADWVLVVCGYSAEALRALSAGGLSAGAMGSTGRVRMQVSEIFTLAYSATAGDIL